MLEKWLHFQSFPSFLNTWILQDFELAAQNTKGQGLFTVEFNDMKYQA